MFKKVLDHGPKASGERRQRPFRTIETEGNFSLPTHRPQSVRRFARHFQLRRCLARRLVFGYAGLSRLGRCCGRGAAARRSDVRIRLCGI